MHRHPFSLAFLCVSILFGESVLPVRAETILQYFGTPWMEIARRMPELAEAGYTSLWLPPPQKASGQLSVGFDTSDRFDLGDKPRAGGATKYGTKTDLLHLMEVAHRFGIRVYFDNIMAHTGGFTPQGEPYDLNDLGFVPADFHLIRREDGSYYKMDWPDWEDEWQVLHRNPFSWDLATDWGGYNNSFGAHEGAVIEKWVGVRHPNNPEYYDFDHNGNHVGFGHVTQEMIDANPAGYAEEVNDYLMRSIRWLIDTTKADGFRLDAVKHVRADFFGADGDGKDESSFGYTGQIQWQFNQTHGYGDSNHRNALFDPQTSRDDAMLFGEHLGSRHWWENQEGNYLGRGMRIANDNFLNAVKDNIGNSLEGMAQRGYGIYSGNPHNVAHYVMSHDNVWLWGGDRKQAHAMMLAREGLPIVYTDGYNQSGPPDWFPEPSHVPYLGQFDESWLPHLLFVRRHFGWGGHWTRWDAWDQAAWIRGSGDDHDGASMVFVLIKNYLDGAGRSVEVASPFNDGDIIYQYGWWGSARRKVQDGTFRQLDGNPIWVGDGDYAVFSWRLPRMPAAWALEVNWWEEDIRPIMIYQNDEAAETIWVPRKDGRDGDPAFNPYGLPNTNTTDHTYAMPVPRVTRSSNLSFIARADGTAANILMKLDGGIDLNAHMWTNGNHDVGARDNAPGQAADMYLGFEQMQLVQRIAEKFASADTEHNLWGSPGATSYECTIGQAGFVMDDPEATPNDWQSTFGPAWLYHDPAIPAQFSPAPTSAAGQPVEIEVEIGHHPFATNHRAFIYYTTDGVSWPEGSGGVGKGSTEIVEMVWDRESEADKHWWRGAIPALPDGTTLRYKIGAYRRNIDSRFPWSESEIDLGARMETLFAITNFNAGTIELFPHNNWNLNQRQTGLREGFHVLRTKSFLGRAEGHAPIFREQVQTFYYDTERPTGRFVLPATDGEGVSGSYGLVLRTDMTVTEVWYQIDETDAGTRPWARAYRGVVPAPLPDGTKEQEWRFEYDGIATSGWATVSVKLREVSSSNDLALDDEEGHFTTLTRELITGGGLRIYVVDPPAGSTVGHGTNLVVRLSRELLDGIGEDTHVDAFTLANNGVPITNAEKSIHYDAAGPAGDHAVIFTLPSFYNGDPDFAHALEVTFERDGFDALKTTRHFFAKPEGGLIPTSWESQWGLASGTLDPSGMGDYDGNGISDYHEYLANTNPTDPNDHFRVGTLHPHPLQQELGLEFLARENRHYFVWSADTLVSPAWSLFQTNPISGAGLFTNLPLNIEGMDRRYFRLEVAVPTL